MAEMFSLHNNNVSLLPGFENLIEITRFITSLHYYFTLRCVSNLMIRVGRQLQVMEFYLHMTKFVTLITDPKRR